MSSSPTPVSLDLLSILTTHESPPMISIDNTNCVLPGTSRNIEPLMLNNMKAEKEVTVPFLDLGPETTLDQGQGKIQSQTLDKKNKRGSRGGKKRKTRITSSEKNTKIRDRKETVKILNLSKYNLIVPIITQIPLNSF